MTISSRLKELNLDLPSAVKPAFQYAAVVHSGDHAFVSGQLPKTGAEHDLLHYGRVGAEVTLEQGRECARACVLQGLAVTVEALGANALERIEQVVQVTGFVSAAPEFYQHPKVIDGASELLVDIFGERGRHARAAVGVASLPRNAPVEIAFIFRIGNDAGGPQ